MIGNQNPKLKRVRSLLRDAEVRRESKEFVIEGKKLFAEMPRKLISEVYLAARFEREETAFLAGSGLYPSEGAPGRDLRGGIPYEVVEDSRFDALCDTKSPQGILAVVRMPEFSLDAVLTKEAPLLVLLEEVQDPGNVGTILRTSEAAGADAVFLTEGCADLYAPKCVRGTMGSLFRLPHFQAGKPEEWKTLFADHGIEIFAAHLAGSVRYDTPDYRKGTVFLIGNEGRGLSEEAAMAADRHVRIPMAGELNSLNAAMSCGILLYEAARQRKFGSAR